MIKPIKPAGIKGATFVATVGMSKLKFLRVLWRLSPLALVLTRKPVLLLVPPLFHPRKVSGSEVSPQM